MPDGIETELTLVEEEQGRPDSNIIFFLYQGVTVFILKCMLTFILIFQAWDLAVMKCYRGGECSCDDKFLSTYCWVEGTHTVLRHHNKTVGKQVPHLGMGQVESNDVILHHSYYIWIHPFLFLACVLFEAPWWMWDQYWEGKRIRAFMKELNVFIVKDAEEINEKKNYMMSYFCAQVNSRIHTRMAMRYIACEVANLLHVLGQMALTDYLLNGEFSTYGFEVISFLFANQDSRVDPVTRVFPKITTCHLNLIGPGGNEQLIEGICVLPMNSLFEKCFVFLWFWYMILASVSMIGLLYRALTVYYPPLRYYLLRLKASGSSQAAIQTICKRSTYGDWLLLFTLKNLTDCFFYDDFLEVFGNKLKQEDENK